MPPKLNKTQIQKWLESNLPSIVLIEFGGLASSRSKFKNLETNTVFTYTFSNLKQKFKANPNQLFGATYEERHEKKKQTNIEKYGENFVFGSLAYKENFEKTHGQDNPSKVKEFQNKKVETSIKKRGVGHHMFDQGVKNKVAETNLERYGVDNVFKSEEFQNKSRNTRLKNGSITLFKGKFIEEWAKDPSLASAMTMRRARNQGLHPDECRPGRSSLELAMKKFLDEMKISYIHDKKLPEHADMKKGFLRPDFLLIDFGLIIECDGEYYHKDKEKDERRNRTYTDLGYDVLCFSGNDIAKDWKTVQEIISEALEQNM